jgi:mono/diheme cytochrome c family protein
MNEEEKRSYLEEYKKEKEKGHPFFPDILVKDAAVALLVFVILIALAYFLGAPLDARANPADTSYTPRPEWYFLFLFQLLKYFPGNFEVIGVILIPTLVIAALFLLPFLDRSPARYFTRRPLVSGLTAVGMIAVVGLTVQAMREAPPPAASTEGDPIAALYARNCAGCHGPSISVPPGTNLHDIIAQGKHEGMPAWSADLTTNEIDALAGFIVSPRGSQLFIQQCGQCHQAPDLAAGNPIQLKAAIEQGTAFAPHSNQPVPNWSQSLGTAEQTALLNFLVAPDGQRLFAVDCSSCHGESVAFSGDESALRDLISKGGLHLEMPPWRERLNQSELDTLARYVVDPAVAPEGQALFKSYCAACHGERVPAAKDVATAEQTIASGGAHQTMPVWGNVLTPEQLDALVSYTFAASQGTPLQLGAQLFSQNCVACHGQYGEGGPNPTRPGDVIVPISSAEFLQTRDDITLRAIITQGQPNFGMSPFGTAFGGPLQDDEIDALVAYLRSWEANPPVELPPEIPTGPIALQGKQIYADLCSQCHGQNGQGGIGPSLVGQPVQAQTDQQIFNSINGGHPATPMIAWGEILTSEQIQELVRFIRQLPAGGTPAPTPSGPLSFATDIAPIFGDYCSGCHGQLGGWDSSSYQSVMSSGNNGPVVIPGDVEHSLLAQKIQGTQTEGGPMPPSGLMSSAQVDTVLQWIAAGAPE